MYGKLIVLVVLTTIDSLRLYWTSTKVRNFSLHEPPDRQSLTSPCNTRPCGTGRARIKWPSLTGESLQGNYRHFWRQNTSVCWNWYQHPSCRYEFSATFISPESQVTTLMRFTRRQDSSFDSLLLRCFPAVLSFNGGFATRAPSTT